MGSYYNAAGDLLVTAYACMKQGKTTKALECAELALQTPEMSDIVIGLKQLNATASDEIEDDEVEIDESCGDKPEEEMEDEELEVEESSDDEDDDEEVEVDDEEEEEDIEDACGKECASADEDDDDDDEEVEVDDEEEEEDIDEAKLDKVLCSLRKQYKVTSSIKKPSTLSSKLKALASKACK